MSESVSFDRAAERYDETRRLSADASRAVTELLLGELDARQPCLEIGIGTGLIALPLHDAGVRMIGVDLSWAMLSKLEGKTRRRARIPVIRGDATRLPLRTGTCGAALARHVLHLIPGWREAIAELVRVVRPGGVLLLNIGTQTGPWKEVQDRFEAEVGPGARRVGLGPQDQGLLEMELDRLGARFRPLPPVSETSDYTLDQYFREAEEGVFSWTWNVPPDRISAAVGATRAWAIERFGATDRVLEPDYPIVWRAYDLP